MEIDGPNRTSRGFVSPDPPQIPPPDFCSLFCRVPSAILMQSASLEFTRSIPESISLDLFYGGFNTSRFCCDVDELRTVSVSLVQPSIDRETRFTPSSSSEFLILGRLIVLRCVKYFPRVLEG